MIIRPLLVLLALSGVVSAAMAAEEDALSKLAAASPFRRPNEPVPAATGPGLVLRGSFQSNGVYYVSVFDQGANLSRWLAVGAEHAGIRVLKFDPATRTAEITRGGRTERVAFAAPAEPRRRK